MSGEVPAAKRRGRGIAPLVAAPGLAVAAAVALAAWAIVRWISALATWTPDAVVAALLVGMAVRAMWAPPARFEPGLRVAGRELLELAIVLLGVSTDLRLVAQAGPWLAGGVVVLTAVALGAGRAIGRMFGLSRTHALLVASGNAICGNSAIVAVATVVRAPAEEAATSIATTALLSIGVVLLLPLVGVVLGLTDLQVGAWAGMTVYAVPQVLAATYPVSVQAGEVATLVKLMRVMLLVPWLTVLAVREHRRDAATAARQRLRRAVLPPYLLAFLALALLRTLGLVPAVAIAPARAGSHALTILAMAALGLGVEPGVLRSVGWRTAAAATASLLVLAVCGLAVALAL